MPYTIPNFGDAAFGAQAAPDKVDLDIITAADAATGVVTGCAVTAQGSPDMTLAVAAGIVAVLNAYAAVAAGNVTITAADATNPRIDLVVVSSAGVKSVTAGTAAANPVMPAVPASSVCLAAVFVPALDAAIQSNQITDKRVTTGFDLAQQNSQPLGSETILANYTASVVGLPYHIASGQVVSIGSGGLLVLDPGGLPSPVPVPTAGLDFPGNNVRLQRAGTGSSVRLYDPTDRDNVSIVALGSTGKSAALGLYLGGDVNYRLWLRENGVTLGDGTNPWDLRTYRSAAKTLTIDDTAGGAATLNVIGTARQNGVPVDFVSGLTFNGTTQYVTVPDAVTLDLGDTWSVELWLKGPSPGAVEQMLVNKGFGAYALKLDTTGHPQITRYGVANGKVSTVAVTDSLWHHVVATRSPGVEHIYVDGVDVSSGSVVGTAFGDTATALLIGAADTTPQAPYLGTLRGVLIYNTELSGATVAAHSLVPPSTLLAASGLAAAYLLNEPTGTLAVDSKGANSGAYVGLHESSRVSGGVARLVAAVAIANTETQVLGYSIPANFMVAGTTFRITAAGRLTSAGATAGTFSIRIGTSSLSGNIAATFTNGPNAARTDVPFWVDFLVTVRTAGAGGTVIGYGRSMGFFAPPTSTINWSESVTSATVAVDTTATKIIEFTYISGIASTTATFEVATIEVVNAA